MKDDRKRRFNLVLGLANFERAIGRSVGARARLQPLLTPQRATCRARSTSACSTCSNHRPGRSRARARGLARPMEPDDAAHVTRRRMRLDGGRADDAIRGRRRAGPALDDLGTGDAVARARPRQIGRVDVAARDVDRREPRPLQCAGVADAGQDPGAARRCAGAERADEALRNALTLEPGWSDLRELRDKIGRRRAPGARPPRRGRAPSLRNGARLPTGRGVDRRRRNPSGWDGTAGSGPGRVTRVRGRRGVSSTRCGERLPPATIDALHDDGPALWALASGVRKLGKVDKVTKTDKTDQTAEADVPAATATCDRLFGQIAPSTLDVQEARFARAIARARRATGGRAGRPHRVRRARARTPSTWPRRARPRRDGR